MFFRGQEGDGAVEGGEHAPPVDVAAEQHRRFGHAGHAHVDDVVFLEVDLRRRTGALNHNDVVFFLQRMIGLHDVGHQRLFIGEVIRRLHGPTGHAVDDDLRAGIVGGLEQDGVHPHRRSGSRRLGLHHLGPAHFQSLRRDAGVEGHILRLEGGHPVAVLPENAAQRRRQQALSRVGRRSLYHDRLCHFKAPPAMSG